VVFLVQVLVPVLFGITCTQVTAPVTELPKELMPLTVGNKWRYLSGLFNPPDTTIFEITRKMPVTIDSVTYDASAYIYYRQGGTKPEFEWLHWNGADGLYWLGGVSGRDSLFIKKLGFKYPAEVGESWLVPILAYSRSDERFYIRDTLTFHVIATDEEIETPAGKFKCYVYKYSRKPADDVLERWDYYEYYFPGLGPVAFISRGQSDQRLIDRAVLYDYQMRK
jgi:hypothetical protein